MSHWQLPSSTGAVSSAARCPLALLEVTSSHCSWLLCSSIPGPVQSSFWHEVVPLQCHKVEQHIPSPWHGAVESLLWGFCSWLFLSGRTCVCVSASLCALLPDCAERSEPRLWWNWRDRSMKNGDLSPTDLGQPGQHCRL